MTTYSIVPFDVISNMNGYVYYKLLIDGVSHYDAFVEELKRLPNEQRSLRKVLTLMEMISPNVLLMKNKIRQIKGTGRTDVYEFKDPPCVRIYVVLNKPDIYIVAGGLKKNQEATIKRITKLLKNFNIEEINL